MSAYSDWKCGAISEEEYNDYCRWEDARDRAYEPADYCDDYDEDEESC